MLDGFNVITVKNTKGDEVQYPIAFTLNVMEAAQEKYGTFQKWAEKLSSGADSVDIAAIIWTFETAINEGIDIENDDNGTKRPFITKKQAGRIVSSLGLSGALSTLQSNVVKATKSDEEEDPNE